MSFERWCTYLVHQRSKFGRGGPHESGAVAWRRTVALHRGEVAVVTDSFESDRDDNDVVLHLITPLEAVVKAPGTIDLEGAVLTYDPALLDAELDGRTLDEPNPTPVWGSRLTRIRLTGRTLPRSAVLSASVQ